MGRVWIVARWAKAARPTEIMRDACALRPRDPLDSAAAASQGASCRLKLPPRFELALRWGKPRAVAGSLQLQLGAHLTTTVQLALYSMGYLGTGLASLVGTCISRLAARMRRCRASLSSRDTGGSTPTPRPRLFRIWPLRLASPARRTNTSQGWWRMDGGTAGEGVREPATVARAIPAAKTL